MPNRSNKARWITVLGAIFLVGVLAYSSFQATRQRYLVCMAFKGAQHCATAAGATESEAIRSAEQIDCQLLTNGRDENMVCLDMQPTSVSPAK